MYLSAAKDIAFRRMPEALWSPQRANWNCLTERIRFPSGRGFAVNDVIKGLFGAVPASEDRFNLYFNDVTNFDRRFPSV